MQFEDFEATARAVLAAETALTRAASFFGSALSASASASAGSASSASSADDASMAMAAAPSAEPGTPAYFASLAAQAVELGVPNLAAGAALPGAFVTLHIANVRYRARSDGRAIIAHQTISESFPIKHACSSPIYSMQFSRSSISDAFFTSEENVKIIV